MKIKKAVCMAIAVIFVAVSAAAASTAAGNEVHIFIEGNLYLGETFLLPGTTYVSLRQFSERFADARVSWDAGTGTATVRWRDVALSAREGDTFLEAGGRILPCPLGIFISGGRIFVPVRPLASVFGYSVKWVEGSRIALLKPGEPFVTSSVPDGSDEHDEAREPDELYWLSRIISAEAEGEPFEGKLAVGTVIMNRLESPEYPDTVYGVIFDDRNGVQFTPTANGAIYREPDGDSIRAAEMCLGGYRTRGDILFFMNEKLAESLWIKNNCTFAIAVGNHDFYS